VIPYHSFPRQQFCHFAGAESRKLPFTFLKGRVRRTVFLLPEELFEGGTGRPCPGCEAREGGKGGSSGAARPGRRRGPTICGPNIRLVRPLGRGVKRRIVYQNGIRRTTNWRTRANYAQTLTPLLCPGEKE
jgi:hypothetical protein